MNSHILLAHGSGGKLSHDLVEKQILPLLGNPLLNKLDDSSIFHINGQVAFSTDSYVVNPIFFPGGDIGKLAVCGTVNDLSMSGARPLYLSLSLIIEEGFLLEDLNRIVVSIKNSSYEAGVSIVTGDTKVVNRGQADKLFINTSGIGIIPPGCDVSGSNAKVGDKIIVSGSIGDHGIAVMSQREGLKFDVPVQSDCAPLNKLVAGLIENPEEIHCLRDPTRGGLSGTLNEFTKQSHNVSITIEEEAIPIKEEIKAACELLGLDPINIANEGKLVAVVSANAADKILSRMQQNCYGRESRIIGEVTSNHPGKVIMRTRLGSSRIVEMMTGELLPRIC